MRRIGIAALTALAALSVTLRVDAEPASGTARFYDIGIYVTDLDRTAAFYEAVFGFKVVRRWTSMADQVGNRDQQDVPLAGMFVEDASGAKLEFLQKGTPTNRQFAQEPINHFSFQVEDVQATLDRALAAGATLVAPGPAIHITTIGDDFAAENTQFIGLDGERIQILREFRP